MSGLKRSAAELDQDPDYEDIAQHDDKRLRLIEQGAKEVTVRRIEGIILREFAIEKEKKAEEIMLIDERLQQARLMLDRIRACIIANLYGRSGQTSQGKVGPHENPSVHPTVKKYLGKAPRQTPPHRVSPSDQASISSISANGNHALKQTVRETKKEIDSDLNRGEDRHPTIGQSQSNSNAPGHSRFKVKKRIIVGNVSKYIPVDKRELNDQSTHKWMVYVRGPAEEAHIDEFVSKVWFFLHPSYRPHDLVEISERPFHLTRRGWGEFPVRVQLHFKDLRNKRVDIIHQLKLDRTYTSLQTLGAETVVDIELEKDGIGLGPSRGHTPPALPSTGPSSFTSSSSTTPSGNIDSTEVNLSLVKTERQDSEERVQKEDASLKGAPPGGVTIKAEPQSPVRQGAVTPVNMVLSVPSSSGTLLAGGTRTPDKDTSRWTHHVQIKSEPNSPQHTSPSPARGWKNLSSLSSPLKPEPDSGTSSPQRAKVSLLSKTPPEASTSQRSGGHVQAPAQIILTPGGSVIHVAQQNSSQGQSQGQQQNSSKGQGQGKGSQISLMTGQAALSTLQVTTKGQSVNTEDSLGNGGQAQTLLLGPSPCQPKVSPLPSPTTARNQQSAVYIRCLDTQGKVYLIPQHLLNKTSVAAAMPTAGSMPRPMQKISTPSGMTLVPSSGKPNHPARTPTPSPSTVAMATVKGARTVLVGQESAGQGTADGAAYKGPPLTTTIKTGVGTATLTYILASTAPTTSTTATPPGLSTPGARLQPVMQKLAVAVQPGVIPLPVLPGQVQGQGQSLILASPPGQGQRLILAPQPGKGQSQGLFLASPGSQGQGQSLILASQPGKGQSLILTSLPNTSQSQSVGVVSSPQTAVSGKTSLPVTPVSSKPGTLGNIVSARVEPSRRAAQMLTENVRIIGSNIVATGSSKSPGVIIVSTPSSSTTQGTTVTTSLRVAAPTPSGGVSLLTGLPSLQPATSLTSRPSLLTAPQRTHTPVISLLSKATSGDSTVSQVRTPGPPATLLIKPEPRFLAGNVGAMTQVAPTPSKPAPLLLIRNPASAPIRPRNLVPPDQTAKSILKTIGNQTVLVQLLPNQGASGSDSGSKGKDDSPGGATSTKPCSEVQSHLVIKPEKSGTGTYFIHADGETIGKTVTKDRKLEKGLLGKVAEWKKKMCLSRYNTMEELVGAVVRMVPLIQEGLDRSEHPYCAGSEMEYQNWKVAKRRSAEWMRTCAVRSRIVDLLEEGNSSVLTALGPPWSKKKVLWWCRHHGYSPLDKGLEEFLHRQPSTRTDHQREPLNSYSDAGPLVETLVETCSKLPPGGSENGAEEEPLDIVSLISIPKPKVQEERVTPLESRDDHRLVLESSPGVEFVHEVAAQMGVPLAVTPVDPDQRPLTYAPVVADMILSAALRLVEDILRTALSLTQKQHRFSEELTATDIYSAIRKLPHCDFLSNAGLGVQALDGRATAESAPLPGNGPV